MKKIKLQRDHSVFNVIIIISVLLLIFGVIYIGWAMHSSWKIRQFKNDIWVVTNESDVHLAEYNGVKVNMSDANTTALGTLPALSKYRLKFKDATPTDTVTYTLCAHGTRWELCISVMDNGLNCITLTGERNYKFYFDDNSEFDRYVKLASPEGYVDENQVMN